MKNYIVYEVSKEIQRTGSCPEDGFFQQTGDGDFVMEGKANDTTQKIEFDGFDAEGQPINPRVIDKTPEEIEADNPTPPEMSESQRPARITNEQWQKIQDRLDDLENSV